MKLLEAPNVCVVVMTGWLGLVGLKDFFLKKVCTF